MPIPESQLKTWSHQGSITQSSKTYNTVKNVLESTVAGYSGKDYKVFLQGSYGNSTNIYSESDVDIVIRLNSCFYKDLTELSEDQIVAYHEAHSNSDYCYFEFKRDVLTVLNNAYPDSISEGNCAIRITAGGSRRNADVLVATEYRRYRKFLSLNDEVYDTGICFHRADGTETANYPEQHSRNCTVKQQMTNERFKAIVRILKNMRGQLVDANVLSKDAAPSYFIEGLLYNVPNGKFEHSYGNSFVNCLNWLLDADRSEFVCANKQYYLLRDNSSNTWRADLCDKFLEAILDMWNRW